MARRSQHVDRHSNRASRSDRWLAPGLLVIRVLRKAGWNLRTRWLSWPVDAAVVLTIGLAYTFAPDAVGATTGWSQYFATVAQVSVTLLVAVALFGGMLDGVVEHHVLRWASGRSFLYLGAATSSGLLGSIGSMSEDFQRCLLGLSAGAFVGSLVTVLLMGHSNIAQRRRLGAAARASKLDPRPSTASGVGGASAPSPGKDRGRLR